MSDYEPDDRPEPDDWENGDSDQAHLARWLDEHEDNDEMMTVTVPPTSVLSIIHAGLDALGDTFGVEACREWLAQFLPLPPLTDDETAELDAIEVEAELDAMSPEEWAVLDEAMVECGPFVTAARVTWDHRSALAHLETARGVDVVCGATPAIVLNALDRDFPELRFVWAPAGDCEMVATISQREATVAS